MKKPVAYIFDGGERYVLERYVKKYYAPKKRMQFSQKMTLISAVFSMLFVVGINLANFILLWHDKQPMPQEAVTAMTIYGGITSTLTFGGYCALSLGRDISKNNNEIKDDG